MISHFHCLLLGKQLKATLVSFELATHLCFVEGMDRFSYVLDINYTNLRRGEVDPECSFPVWNELKQCETQTEGRPR